MPPAAPDRRRFPLLRPLLVSLALSAAGVAAALLLAGGGEGLAALGRVSGASVAAAAGLLGVSLLAGGLRLWALVLGVGARVTPLRAVRAHVLGLLAAAVTPSGGGNAPAIALSLRRDGVPTAAAWSITVYTSVLDLLFFAWAIPLAAWGLRDELGARLLGLALLLGAACLLLWYGLAHRQAALERLAARLFALRPLRRWQRPAWRFVRRMNAATGRLTAASPWRHLGLQALTALMHGALYAIFWGFAVALGTGLELLPTLALLLLVSVSSYVVPTPGGSGYLELAISWLFARRAPAGEVAAALVAYRAVGYYAAVLLGLPLGGAVLVKEAARHADRDGDADPDGEAAPAPAEATAAPRD